MAEQIIDTSFDGNVVTFYRPDTPRIHCRIKKPDNGKWDYKSTRTTDRRDALNFAEDLYANAKLRHRAGLSSKPVTFKEVAEKHIEQMKDDVVVGDRPDRDLKDYIPIINRYFVPYFGSKEIDTITAPDIEAYLNWRKRYWIDGPGSEDPFIEYERKGRTIRRPASNTAPSSTTLNKENVALRGVFDMAVRESIIPSGSVPPIKGRNKNRRTRKEGKQFKAGLSLAEWGKLRQKAEEWIKSGKRKDSKDRYALTWDYIVFLIHTGIRPGTETDGMTWKNIKNRETRGGNFRQENHVNGKTGPRAAMGTRTASRALSQIKGRRESHIRETKGIKGWVKPPIVPLDEPVFCLPDGTHITNEYFRGAFDRFLDFAGLSHDDHGRKFSIYSCRHTFARNYLNYGVAPSVYWLRDQMGTSISMIEKYYGDTSIFAGADQMVDIDDINFGTKPSGKVATKRTKNPKDPGYPGSDKA
jgi:hypothetical protein